jgi:P-type Ca2+ transporter type 2C
LSGREAVRRLQIFGLNAPFVTPEPGWPGILRRQLLSKLIVLLLVATAISLVLGEWLNAAAIGITIVASVAFGFFNEFRSERAVAALKSLMTPTTEVVRDGLREEIPSTEVVPGDVLSLSEGNLVAADARVVESRGLLVNESILTGEPAGVQKAAAASPNIDEDSNETVVFAGTTVAAGSALALVISTGDRTELGRISSAVLTSERGPTPLEKRIDQLGNNLVLAFLGLCAVVVMIGLAQGRETILVLEIAVALAIGAVPEGLPAVATTTLALAVRRLARHQVIVRRLDAVESLGSTTTIVTDKTGTLTENRMVLRSVILPDGREVEVAHSTSSGGDPLLSVISGRNVVDSGQKELIERPLLVAALCSDAVVEEDSSQGWHAHGDPTETAIAMAAAGLGYTTDKLAGLYPRLETEPFTAASRMMTTTHAMGDGGKLKAMKGSLESVSKRIDNFSPVLKSRVEDLSSQGFRVLAVAQEAPGSRSELLGALVIEDPLRPDAVEAVRACQRAGLRIVLATGDHPNTARNVGEQTGILHGPLVMIEGDAIEGVDLNRVGVIARASHAQKKALVERLKATGEVTAMLGDGVNDAPALTAADVAVAVGPNASDVAIEASHVLVTDGRLQSLVEGIEEGRQVARNLTQAIMYLLIASFGTILLITLAMLSTDLVPLAPLQILWLNLVVHVFPALALSVAHEPLEDRTRPTTSIVSNKVWREIAVRAATVAVAGVSALLISNSWGEASGHTQTMVFGTVAIGLVGQAFFVNVKGLGQFSNRVKEPLIWLAVGASLLLTVAAVHAPGLRPALGLVSLSASDWMATLTCTFSAWLGAQLLVLSVERNTSL